MCTVRFILISLALPWLCFACNCDGVVADGAQAGTVYQHEDVEQIGWGLNDDGNPADGGFLGDSSGDESLDGSDGDNDIADDGDAGGVDETSDDVDDAADGDADTADGDSDADGDEDGTGDEDGNPPDGGFLGDSSGDESLDGSDGDNDIADDGDADGVDETSDDVDDAADGDADAADANDAADTDDLEDTDDNASGGDGDIWIEIDYSNAWTPQSPSWTLSDTDWGWADWAFTGESGPEAWDRFNSMQVVDDPIGTSLEIGSSDQLQLMIGLTGLISYSSVSVELVGRSMSTSSSVTFDVYNPLSCGYYGATMNNDWWPDTVELDLAQCLNAGGGLQAVRVAPTNGTIALISMRVTIHDPVY